MHGIELEALLGGYKTGLEDLSLQGPGGTVTSSTPVSGEQGFFKLDNALVDVNANIVNQLAEGAASLLLHQIGNRSPVSSSVAFGSTTPGLPTTGEMGSIGSLIEGDGGAGRLAALLRGPFVPPGIGAFLDLFKGDNPGDSRIGYQANPYTWESPSHSFEGLDSATSGVSKVDSRYDGLPRAIESRAGNGSRIDVRIEALDARSILDRKEDIAEAVRQAMLTSGVLGAPLNEY
ncbi:MAG: hypothetical protein ABI972_00975 [Acidobacteriota bacterium]